jgi:hypothetical protein
VFPWLWVVCCFFYAIVSVVIAVTFSAIAVIFFYERTCYLVQIYVCYNITPMFCVVAMLIVEEFYLLVCDAM